jgi:glycosyltransferase involved in cell wall biosynthesis
MPGPYQAQTSGIFCEAAALGIPVVTSEGTWVADQVARSGSGVLFKGGDEDSLADACLEAIRNYSHLRQRAEQAAPDWRAFHNPQNYLAQLDALIVGAATAHAA